jgi:hypothetical protein
LLIQLRQIFTKWINQKLTLSQRLCYHNEFFHHKIEMHFHFHNLLHHFR